MHHVDLSVPPDQDTASALRRAWHQFGVLFFRNQRVTDEQLPAAASVFGEPVEFRFSPPVRDDLPLVHVIHEEGARPGAGVAIWHSDATWMAQPPIGTMLAAARLPGKGGDTCFAHAGAAYDNLSTPLRGLAERLTAVHEGGGHLARSAAMVEQEMPDRPISHPVVRTHPASGRRCLFVNRLFTTRINELSEEESRIVLGLLCDQVRAPEVQIRWQWQPGDVAVWDNRCLQHYAVQDYSSARTMHRVTLAGEVVHGPSARTMHRVTLAGEVVHGPSARTMHRVTLAGEVVHGPGDC